MDVTDVMNSINIYNNFENDIIFTYNNILLYY